MEVVALIILIIFSLAGFAGIFFTPIGTFIILAGSIIYAILTGFDIITVRHLIILLLLCLCGEVLEYVMVVISTKKFGGSNKAALGALIGGVIGAMLGTAFLGIGIILGTFLGIFLGIFLSEIITKRDLVKSLKAGAGGIIGRFGAIAAKVVVAIIMLIIIGVRVT
ncbi:DUF456 domain-containing protein [candidate division NPL-UPA2 bacterium Unc8]|uniref:DUF456 domain-containing protein n=1 Tax=candidate division NPL-UPA2 bacterium Unc8 TaxID=1980939 RepID=A0A399FZ66_UNCN2|nr:hypothetical protein [Bacillota bacterium]RII00552.1 MAG: DUF456 domain-containing protein [candidate division NPL-UPA2 bacterium Unc8]